MANKSGLIFVQKMALHYLSNMESKKPASGGLFTKIHNVMFTR